MYQIFVVEDELLIRQNIRTIIENMEGPYAFCGEASDGEMALSMMQDLMPDILLTDIKMPFLDGFGLIRLAKGMMPWLKTAIITGYGDFEYAKEAISLGVNQYLLKPVLQAELVKTIEQLAAQIDQSRASRGQLPEGLNEDEMMWALRQQLLREILYGLSDTERILERALVLKLDIIRSHYLTAVCSFNLGETNHRALRSYVRRILDGEESLLYYFNDADKMTILAYDNNEEALNEHLYQLANILKHELSDICESQTIVIGDDVDRLGAICEAYKAAAEMLKTVSAVAAGTVVNVKDSAQVSAELIRIDSPFGEKFQEKLQFAKPEDVPRLLDEVLSSPEGKQFESLMFRYHALISLSKTAAYLMANNVAGADENELAIKLNGQFDLISASGSEGAFRKTAAEILQYALKFRASRCREMNYQQIIRQAQDYVKKNFGDPNISLVSTARHVGMSSAYFSTVFSQTAGRSFISYLTAVRLEKAKELLAKTDMRLSDIAVEVGYNEPNYFSHVFRKAEGMTPKDYRARVSTPGLS